MEVKKSINGELKVFALGGLYEVGKNMYCLEYNDELIIIDSGILFPDSDMYGIDYIIPDYSYLIQNQEKIKGLFITHGHEDHIGGIPYLLKQVNIPKIYSNGLTIELIKKKLEDHHISDAKIYDMNEFERISFKHFEVSYFRMSHSIPDSFGLIISTPLGIVVSTGDFKFDFTPVGKDADYQKLCALGSRGIMLLMSDSTNSRVGGLSTSEKKVSESIRDLFAEVDGRVIIATFASNVNRINAIIEASIQTGRKVCVVGRSMEHIVDIGRNLGYINATPDQFIEDREIERYEKRQITVICTGTQGEPMAALTRIAQGANKQIKIEKDDTVIFSSSAIPGNSPEIDNVINLLTKAGANVIVRSSFNDVHASGHAGMFEQMLMLKLLRPKYFMPMHGEFYMLKTHAQTAQNCGIDPKNIFILDNGRVLSITKQGARILSQKVPAKNILIDGTDIGGVNTQVIEERKALSMTGMISVVVTVNKDGIIFT
ncbi:MAG: ribonuclease J, partial [Gammaproteobacteria bacterium]|nr:ribonuclease J [Gammaproteobacteria bacterium]